MNSEIGLIFLSGLSIGILGSFHCIGMCGPLALTLPVNQLSTLNKIVSISFYNFGRVLTYIFLGVFFGILGKGISIFELQQWLSVVAGIFILVVLLAHKYRIPGLPLITRFTNTVKLKLSNFLTSKKKTITFLAIGIVNGFLPCGLVYVAIAASFAAGSVINSGLVMFGFGLGTIPLMASVMIFGNFISIGFRRTLNKVSPYLIILMAVLLILRGLNLGIPYVSPKLQKSKIDCCEK